MAVEQETSVPSAAGALNAVVRVPELTGPLPGVVLVDGAGDGDRWDWGGWPEWISEAGAVVLRHDKPGCGGSPGHWTEQTLHDRAQETLAAVEVLRGHPAVSGEPVGLYGISQGGWVALLAAVLGEGQVDFVVSHSGPGVTPAAQERIRLERDLAAAGHSPDVIAEAMSWVDERAARLISGEAPETILADQSRHSDRSWYPAIASGAYDAAAVLAFAGRIFDFDPVTVLPKVSCPVLALFGGSDELIPVEASVAAFAANLPERPGRHGLAVFPRGDHGLYTAEPDPSVPRRAQLASGYEEMLAAFLRDQRQAGVRL
ncbi:alpha/beta hydrolase family protein [Phytoactinopolyspora mesophila]|uniref:Alpha/beta fold hydrolase n=1 Tax=Phytoactinopolyspora mesophila TaxID=2650750 RepID=A0A7K3M732_9ACTN|nr:alpha/beta hydrolase [Phytoactinopolyspora mesophila]NDL59129.1 alpha/beta fold hydrolase [Phytoactinopolyspora mesophila]